MTDCKHDWHFIEGTERLRCERCKAETGPKTYEQRVQDMLQDVTTIGSAWSKDGERIDPTSVYKDFEPWTTEQVTVPTGQLYSLGNDQARLQHHLSQQPGSWWQRHSGWPHGLQRPRVCF